LGAPVLSGGFSPRKTLGEEAQLAFPKRELRKTAVLTDEEHWENKDGGLIETFPSWKMNVDLRAKGVLVVRAASYTIHTAPPFRFVLHGNRRDCDTDHIAV